MHHTTFSSPRPALKIGFYAAVFAFLLLPLGGARAAPPPALPNFHTVSPGIYRGGAPSEAGLHQLKAMGIKTVIDLRISPRRVKKEGQTVRSLGMNWINLPMGGDPPTMKEVATLLATLRDPSKAPVFVHCEHGADRTGCMIGIYRITDQGWTYAQALTEMRKYGFNPHWVKLSNTVRQCANAKHK